MADLSVKSIVTHGVPITEGRSSDVYKLSFAGGNSGLSFGRFQNDIGMSTKNNDAVKTFTEIVKTIPGLLTTSVNAFVAAARANRLTPDQREAADRAIANNRAIVDKLDEEQAELLTGYVNTVATAAAQAAASVGPSIVSLFDPRHPDYVEAVTLVASWTNQSDPPSKITEFVSGKTVTLNNNPNPVKIAGNVVTLDDLKSYLGKTKQYAAKTVAHKNKVELIQIAAISYLQKENIRGGVSSDPKAKTWRLMDEVNNRTGLDLFGPRDMISSSRTQTASSVLKELNRRGPLGISEIEEIMEGGPYIDNQEDLEDFPGVSGEPGLNGIEKNEKIEETEEFKKGHLDLENQPAADPVQFAQADNLNNPYREIAAAIASSLADVLIYPEARKRAARKLARRGVGTRDETVTGADAASSPALDSSGDEPEPQSPTETPATIEAMDWDYIATEVDALAKRIEAEITPPPPGTPDPLMPHSIRLSPESLFRETGSTGLVLTQ